MLNCDASIYGGDNVGNMGATLCSVVLPQNGLVVLERVG